MDSNDIIKVIIDEVGNEEGALSTFLFKLVKFVLSELGIDKTAKIVARIGVKAIKSRFSKKELTK